MAIKLSQSMKQTQSLMMTPQLQQAIKLLTLTHIEMTNLISEEMVENPMLEESGIDGTDSKNEADYKIETLEGQNQESSGESIKEEPIMKKEGDDFDWQTYVDTYENNSSSPPSMAKADLDELPNYENIVSRGANLVEHLEWQLRMESLNDDEMKLAMDIIYSINDDGYLSLKFEELIADTELEREHARSILGLIQRLDPVGCGAENLVDCLLAQAKIAEERSPLLEKIIRDHLEDIRCNDFEKIAKTTGVTSDIVRSTIELLQNFHPKPGRLVSSAETHYVVPDIYVIEVGGVFVVKVNDEGVPRLKISKLYQQMLKNPSVSSEANDFVTDKLNKARWLIKSIQNRQKTIHKVTEAIVSQQQEFFKKGPKFLKPMVLKNIANEIGMHESTVSRVTTNKYMHTPIGLFELKYFFNSGVGGKDGGVDISSEVLKLKIKSLLENESPKKPLSDQKIADLLSRDDVKVARRTIAKYREILGILSSSKRKIKG